MCLSGVDIDLTNEDGGETDLQGQHYWENSDLQELWLAGRPNSLSHDCKNSGNQGMSKPDTLETGELDD